MNIFVFIADAGLGMQEIIESCQRLHRVHVLEPDRIRVDMDGDYFFVTSDPFIASEIGPEAARIDESMFGDPQYFSVVFRGAASAEAAIRALPEHHRIIIDNDHGLTIERHALLAMINRGETWIR